MGLKVSISDHPARIVTLSPNVAEIAASLLGSNLERIVGVSEYTDFPPGLLHVKSIGPYARFNLEEVVALKPELVLANWNGNSKDQIDHLRELGLPVVTVKTDHLSDISSAIKMIADAMNLQTEGARAAAQFEADLRKIQLVAQKKAGAPAPRVLLQLDTEPMVVAGKGSFLNDALEKIGAVNIYGDSNISYPRPSMEDAVARNPDVIVFLGMKTGASSVADSQAELTKRILGLWQRFPGLRAVKANKVEVLLSDEIVRPSPRVVAGLEALERAVYGK